MRSFIVGLLALPFLAPSLSTFAQSSATNAAAKPGSFVWHQDAAPSSPTVVLRSDGSQGGITACPVGMRARQGGGGQLREARDRDYPLHRPVSRLRLTLFRWSGAPDLLDPSQAREATVTVRGLMAKTRMLPAEASDGFANSSADGVNLVGISRTMTVHFALPDEEGISADLNLPGFASARLIQLNSITYADGTTRKFSSQDSCRIAPDPLMFVESR